MSIDLVEAPPVVESQETVKARSSSAKIAYAALIALLASVAWLHLVSRIHLLTADLGRHIRNGELAVVDHHIVTTNQYSYTFPDLPVICHHWAAGVPFYLVWKALGFSGLSIFYGSVLFLALALFSYTAARAASMSSALLATVLALPLAGTRIEIRPEGFTVLFLGLNFLLLYGQRSGWFSSRRLWLIPLVHLVWVNVHVMFSTGFVLLGIFIVDAVVVHGFGARMRMLMALTLVALALSLLNPYGLDGLIEPIRLYSGGTYSALAENQSVFWMMQAAPGVAVYKYSLVVAAGTVVLFLLRLIAERNLRHAFLPFAVLACFVPMALQSVRSLSMLGLFFIPVAADNWERVIAVAGARWRPRLRGLTAVVAATIVVAAATMPTFFFSPLAKFSALSKPDQPLPLLHVLTRPQMWSGLVPGSDGSAVFFKKAALRGPVFNNYDIGGFFIFNFYPQERVFVDNRPEAYPADFLKDVYNGMQADNSTWSEMRRRYGIELIFFYRLDRSELGQRFLVQRISDPDWAPIFVDAYVLILAKRGGVNQAAIEKYELPRDMFEVRRNR